MNVLRLNHVQMLLVLTDDFEMLLIDLWTVVDLYLYLGNGDYIFLQL